MFDDYILNGKIPEIDCSDLVAKDIRFIIESVEEESETTFEGYETSGKRLNRPENDVKVKPDLLEKKGFILSDCGVLISKFGGGDIPVGEDGLVDLIKHGRLVIPHLDSPEICEQMMKMQRLIFTADAFPNGLSDLVRKIKF